MYVYISNTSDKPLYEQIALQIKGKIISGELPEGMLLPSMRVLAKDLRISVITTKRAYHELEQEGFLITVAGKGTYVAQKDMALVREEHLKVMETYLEKAIDVAKGSGISYDEIVEIVQLLYGEDE